MSAASPSPLQIRHVDFAYHSGQPVLQDVSLDLGEGELLGVIGPNGSGKSSLLRIMSGVLRPQAGEVWLYGRRMDTLSAREIAQTIAAVPQDSHVDFPFSVLEVVLMGRSPYLAGFAFESAADLAYARAAMERTGVIHLAGRTVQELSGGERQRVMLARALAQSTPILLLDEPGAFLDLRHVVEIYDLLRELRHEGKTVVTVLHDLNLAAQYCDRLLLLDSGKVHSSGPPSEVLTYSAITSVYRTDVYIGWNDITNTVNVLPLSRTYREKLRHMPAVEPSNFHAGGKS
jgi:iron complex transport system ATP-binding protein